MSLDIFTSLRAEECATAVKRALPLAKVESSANDATITVDRHRMHLVFEEWGPSGDSFGGIRSKVNIVSVDPQEVEKPLEQSMNEDERLADSIRTIIGALQPVETCSGEGKILHPKWD